jgi:hypothetical protein
MLMTHLYYQWRSPIEIKWLKGDHGRHLVVSFRNPVISVDDDLDLSGYLECLDD